MIGENISRIVRISLGIILILAVIQIMAFNETLVNSVSAGSSWTETTETNFNAGTLNNVVVTADGNVKLALETKYIEDDFIDESKIHVS